MPEAFTPSRRAIEKILDKTGSLYSLPAVALEVIQLTNCPKVDTRALKETIERDPALTAKLLKVVNSSLFGLSGEVGSLNQALALLGVQPLKLLVLGFSLPDRMLADVAGDRLQAYWTGTLTRAVVARELAEQHFNGQDHKLSGDDAFIAAMLQDIGLLVLLGQLGETYGKFLGEAADDRQQSLQLERKSLGFDRTELSAGLVERWQLPSWLSTAIALPKKQNELAERKDHAATVAKALHLAELLTSLVVEHRLAVLPELLEAGDAYCGLTKQQLNTLVEPLEPRVAALAEAMMVDVSESSNNDQGDYQQVLVNAHAQLAIVAENAAENAAGTHNRSTDDDRLCEELLAETHELRLAMQQFLKNPPPAASEPTSPTTSKEPTSGGLLTRSEGAHGGLVSKDSNSTSDRSSDQKLPAIDPQRARVVEATRKVAEQARTQRSELSIAMICLLPQEDEADANTIERHWRAALAGAQSYLGDARAIRLTLDDHLLTILLPAVERRDAVAFATAVVQTLSAEASGTIARAGVATIAAVPNRFDASRLIEGAERCLSGAITSSATPVRSIEVY